MKVFYNNVITFINNLDSFLKVLIICLLLLLDILSLVQIIKTHVNSKKPVFKLLQFVIFGLLLFITVFVCIHI